MHGSLVSLLHPRRMNNVRLQGYQTTYYHQALLPLLVCWNFSNFVAQGRVVEVLAARSPWNEPDRGKRNHHRVINPCCLAYDGCRLTMGKKGKKAQAGKPKKLTPKDVGKRLDVLAKKLEEELEGADLFAPLPPAEDCAICFVPLSHKRNEQFYQACCGKYLCWACYKENKASINKQNEEKNAGKKLTFACPFCREPRPATGLEALRRLQERCLQNDHVALTTMGGVYRVGDYETAKDDLKMLDCWIRAVELGSDGACTCIANRYEKGEGVAVNKERAALFGRIGALRGSVSARHNIGCSEYDFGNHEIAIRHWKIAAEAGSQRCLNALRGIYNADENMPGKEFIRKEEMDTVYRSGHGAQMEVKSEERKKHFGAKQAK